jgi:phage gp36-like protein
MADQAPLCTRADIGQFGARTQALESADVEVQDNTILARSAWICSYLGDRVPLPLLVWGMDLRQACAIAVAWDLTSAPIGRNPEDVAENDPLYLRYKGIERWLEKIADGGPLPVVTGSPGVVGPAPIGSAIVGSNSSRGWQVFSDDSFDSGGAFSGGRR